MKSSCGFKIVLVFSLLNLPFAEGSVGASILTSANGSVCYFNSSSGGGNRHSFVRVTGVGRYFYVADLDRDLKAYVYRILGHNTHFTLHLRYKEGEVEMVDNFVDLGARENLYVEGKIKGQFFNCTFDPNDFGK